MTRRLLQGLALAQAAIAAFLWDKDHGIATTFLLIAAGLWWESNQRPRRKGRR